MFDQDGRRLNILMGADHLTLLKAGYRRHPSWWKRLLSKIVYVPQDVWVVAYFTNPGGASDYVEWAANTGPRSQGKRFRYDSVLGPFDWVRIEPFWTRLPIDPPIDESDFKDRPRLRLLSRVDN